MSDTGGGASKEKAIHSVTRRVMWGEDEASILDSLKSKGYSGSDALDLLRAARRDRVRTIRKIYWPKVWLGLLLIGLGLSVTLAFRFLTDTYPIRSRGQIFVELTPFLYGIWKLLTGLIGILTADSRTGPISEIE